MRLPCQCCKFVADAMEGGIEWQALATLPVAFSSFPPLSPTILFPADVPVRCTLTGQGWATDYAALLLGSLGLKVARLAGAEDMSPAQCWAASGGMALTGTAALPLMAPWPLASAVAGVARALQALVAASGRSLTWPLPDARTLGERAALAGLSRSAVATATTMGTLGGAGRLLVTTDGALALSLPRAEDWALLPAWLEVDVSFSADDAGWQRLAQHLAGRAAGPLVERARLMGLAAAPAHFPPHAPDEPPCWLQVERFDKAHGQDQGQGAAKDGRTASWPRRAPLVVDLSALWAGPLCSHLLQHAGARVLKVESRQRPDGARLGPAAFFDLLNHGKESVVLDFSCPEELAWLRGLLLQADIVIEASRPRALRQLGIVAEEILRLRPQLTWLSISGYGRSVPAAAWIAYGDDAGVAAGLSADLFALTGQWFFCADAIADPLTGWHAALAALAGFYSGGGGLLSLSLVEVVRHCAQFRRPDDGAALRDRWQRWQQQAGVSGSIMPPQARPIVGRARPVGADTARVLAEFGRSC